MAKPKLYSDLTMKLVLTLSHTNENKWAFQAVFLTRC